MRGSGGSSADGPPAKPCFRNECSLAVSLWGRVDSPLCNLEPLTVIVNSPWRSLGPWGKQGPGLAKLWTPRVNTLSSATLERCLSFQGLRSAQGRFSSSSGISPESWKRNAELSLLSITLMAAASATERRPDALPNKYRNIRVSLQVLVPFFGQ